jgi:2-dehydropantoate 2-reductase
LAFGFERSDNMQTGGDHIFIIGAGAIGKALAVFLQVSGKRVTLIRGSVADGIRKTEIIRVEMPDGTDQEAEIEIMPFNAFPAMDGIVVLANKSYGNGQLATALKSKTGNSPIILMQNGLGVERPFMEHGFPEIYRCVLFVTSQLTDGLTIRFRPVAVCPIGIERGTADRLAGIVRQLHTDYMGFRSKADIQHVIWKKAIANCVFNSICPLLEADNGIFFRHNETFELARRIIADCLVIANAKGIPLRQAEVEESVLQISRASDGQLISTLQDIRNKRPTEIDTLNFEIVRIARELHMGDRVREIQLLGELIRLKSEIHIETNKL